MVWQQESNEMKSAAELLQAVQDEGRTSVPQSALSTWPGFGICWL